MNDASLKPDPADPATPAGPAAPGSPAGPAAGAPRTRLEYPFAAPPARGRTIEVAAGVHWMRMPMPGRLDHINVWALADQDGWAIVDTGLRGEDSVAVWTALLGDADSPLAGRPVTRVIVTHMHPDHIGMAGWLTRRYGVALWITRLEYVTCRMLVSDSGREAPPDAITWCRRAGWGDAAIETYRTRFGNFGKGIQALPDSYIRLSDGDRLRIGAGSWRVIVGTGHSPEHACLYDEAAGVLISGDQVLPKISSNVSVHPTEPEADPMADWLGSLAKLRREVAADVLVLPAHGECFRGLHTRLDGLAAGQERALGRLRDALAEPRRVIDLFEALFSRPITQADTGLLGLATGETLACLNHLMHRGEVQRRLDDAGVAWYTHAASA